MSDPPSAPSLWPRAMAVARLVWAVLAAVYVGVFLAAIPFGYASNLSLCTGADCPLQELTLQEVQRLQDLGLSHPAYAAAVTALDVALLVWVLLVGLPLGAAAQIQRYRLFDIDIILWMREAGRGEPEVP